MNIPRAHTGKDARATYPYDTVRRDRSPFVSLGLVLLILLWCVPWFVGAYEIARAMFS